MNVSECTKGCTKGAQFPDVVPDKLPWEELPWEWDGDDEVLCRICDAARPGDDGLCDGCRSAIIVERAR